MKVYHLEFFGCNATSWWRSCRSIIIRIIRVPFPFKLFLLCCSLSQPSTHKTHWGTVVFRSINKKTNNKRNLLVIVQVNIMDSSKNKPTPHLLPPKLGLSSSSESLSAQMPYVACSLVCLCLWRSGLNSLARSQSVTSKLSTSTPSSSSSLRPYRWDIDISGDHNK